MTIQIYGPYEGDDTQSRVMFCDGQCVGRSWKHGSQWAYQSFRHPGFEVFDTPKQLLSHAQRLAVSR